MVLTLYKHMFDFSIAVLERMWYDQVMCGRYYINDVFEKEIRILMKELHGQFREESISGAEAFSSAEGKDVFPGSRAIVLKAGGSGCEAAEMTWGFLNPKGKGLLINARAETALRKTAFSESILHRRCVIPASRFYEWDHAKTKVTFYRPQKDMLYFAGCYRLFEDGERFVILTTAANESMKETHDRMPVILEKEEIAEWILKEREMDRFLAKEMPKLLHEQEYEQIRMELSTTPEE